jgi:zinc protease
MFSSMLSLLILGMPAADAAPIPRADYNLQLDEYTLRLQDFTFPSGLRILFQSERTQPIVAITSVIDRGSEHDQPTMDGIAHVVEHLAFRANHGGVKNWDLIKQMGGSINASTSVDWTNYMTIAPRDTLVPLLRIEALRLKDGVANVTEKDVRTECEIARNELRMRYENAAVGAAWDEIGNALFPADHPYARSTIGSHETLSNINLKAVQDFVRDNYRPEYTTIVVVGDFDLSEAGGLLQDAFRGSEELLMSPEDAKTFTAFETDNDQIKFLNTWYREALSVPTTPIKRIDCGMRKEPPAPLQNKKDDFPKVKGMLDDPHLVVAWSLPGGYCEDQTSMNLSAFLLQNYVSQHLFPNPEVRSKNNDKVGCFVSADEYASQMICFIEKVGPLSKMSYKKLAQEVQDSLYLQTRLYDPNTMQSKMKQMAFMNSKTYGMASILQSVDSVSNLFSGRATATGMYTHFSGDAAYFSSNIELINKASPEQALQIAEKYITRNRMVGVVVEPMDEEERLLREQQAGKSSRSDEVQEYSATTNADRYTSVFPVSNVNKGLIDRQLIKPDLSKLRKFTLDNGLDVAILPYGDAPLVRMRYSAKGDSSNIEPTPGLDMYAMSSYTSGRSSTEELIKVAGFMGGGMNSYSASGSSGNLDAILNKLRWQFEGVKIDSGYYRNKFLKNRISGSKWDGEKPETWSSRYMYQTTFPDHPLGNWMSPAEWEVLKKVKPKELKTWIQTKMQPANSELVIVGKLDPDRVEERVRVYFDSLKPGKGIAITELGFAEKSKTLPERSVFIFDKPIATQTQVSMSCQIAADDHLRDRPKTNVVSDTLSEMIWRTLREEAGVTYGAYAYDQIWKGGTSMIGMQSIVQNDAVGLAVSAMMETIERGQKGDVRVAGIADAKIKTAREFVLGQQSGDQMLNRLSGVGIENFAYFDEMSSTLANVSVDDFKTVLKPCQGHEVFTLVGPVENAKKQLEEAGIAYTVVDWQSEFESHLSPKELKNYKKAQEKKKK